MVGHHPGRRRVQCRYLLVINNNNNMATMTINLGGAPRPLLFGWGALLFYEQRNKRDAITDLQKLETGEVMQITFIVELLYCGLLNGHQAVGKEIDFSPVQVANWITEAMEENDDFITDLMQAFSQSMPQGGKKKATKTVAAR